MTARLFAPRAQRELREAVRWIAEDNPEAALGMLTAALRAAEMVRTKPMLARSRPELATSRFRFWSLRGYLFLLVFEVESDPPLVARFVHQARDLPRLLDDLDR